MLLYMWYVVLKDEDVIHNMGRVDPVADAEVIMTELILADAESVASQLQKNEKKARGQDKDAAANVALLEKLVPHLDEGKPANLLPMDEDELERLKTFHLLSSKPMLYACNLKEEEIADPSSNSMFAYFPTMGSKPAGCRMLCNLCQDGGGIVGTRRRRSQGISRGYGGG